MKARGWDRPPTADLVLAVLVAVAAAFGTALAADLADGVSGGVPGDMTRPATPIGAPGFLLVIVASLGLAVRRGWPLGSLLVAAPCTAGYLIAGYAYGPILIVLMLAVYSAARHAPARAAVWGAAATLIALLVHLATSERALGWLGAVPVAAWVVVPATLGYGLRLRGDSRRRARAEAVRQRVDDERLRVAREVHDVVGHGLAAIKMQADVALHVMSRRPEQARTALEAISQTSGQALDELRATLAVVRYRDLNGNGNRNGPGGDGLSGDGLSQNGVRGADRAPATGLGRLDDLRRRMADAGVAVRLHTSGAPDPPLRAAVDLAGYRIVQESLTNVLRHGRCAQADVTVRYAGDDVTIAVVNPYSGGPAAPGAGSGIAGMRARVEALGGEFAAGPVARRFEVHARLPLRQG